MVDKGILTRPRISDLFFFARLQPDPQGGGGPPLNIFIGNGQAKLQRRDRFGGHGRPGHSRAFEWTRRARAAAAEEAGGRERRSLFECEGRASAIAVVVGPRRNGICSCAAAAGRENVADR